MSYEYLIRRIYNVGRGGKPEANADVYRKLERASKIYKLELNNLETRKPKSSTKSIDELEYEYQVECRKIWMNVSDALREAIHKFGDTLTSEEIRQLQSVPSSFDFVHKEDIDQIIKIAEKILVGHQIFPQ